MGAKDRRMAGPGEVGERDHQEGPGEKKRIAQVKRVEDNTYTDTVQQSTVRSSQDEKKIDTPTTRRKGAKSQSAGSMQRSPKKKKRLVPEPGNLCTAEPPLWGEIRYRGVSLFLVLFSL